jgi:hypothetical protein
MGMLGRTARLAVMALSFTAGGGVLLSSGAHAASASVHAGVPSIESSLVLDPGPGIAGKGRNKSFINGRVKSRFKGRNNATNQNSPTQNLGNQNNSSVNAGGQHNFQSGQCARTKICKIVQKSVFVGGAGGAHGGRGHHGIGGRPVDFSRFRHSWSSNSGSSTSASVKSSFSGIGLRAVIR